MGRVLLKKKSKSTPVGRKLKPRRKESSGEIEGSGSNEFLSGSIFDKEEVPGKYESARCSFVGEDGVQCRGFACSGISFCRVHAKMMGLSRGDIVRSSECDVSYKNLPESYLVRTKFDIGKHPLLYIKLSRLGKSDVEIASEFGVSLGTLMKWVSEISEMKEAYEIGQTMYEAFFLKKGVENLDNDRFNNVLYKYLTMNKLGYSDKMETKSTMSGLHGVMVVPSTMSVSEWESQTFAKEEKERMLDIADREKIGG